MSDRRRQPEYEFFTTRPAGTAHPGTPHPGQPAGPGGAGGPGPDTLAPMAPPVPQAAPSGAPDHPPGTGPVNQFGTPLSQYPPGDVPISPNGPGGFAPPGGPMVPQQWSGPGQAWAPRVGAPRARTSGTPLVIGLVVLGLVVVAILGAASAFVLGMKPRGAPAAQWKRTTVELPPTWRGAELTQVDGQIPFGAPQLGAGRAVVGSYQVPHGGQSQVDQFGGPAYGGTAVVMASKFGAPMSETNQKAFRKGFARSWRMMGIELEGTDPGQLGGWMGCGTGRQSAGGLTVCMATDASSYVVTMFDNSFTDAPAAARELREATVRR